MKYVEFPPSHYSWNMHCKLPATKYNKPYYVSNYFKRNKQIAEYSDIIVAFIPDGVESRGTMSTINYAIKEKKLTKINLNEIDNKNYEEIALQIISPYLKQTLSDEHLKKIMNNPILLDTRNIINIKELNEYDFKFDNVGRGD